MSPYVYITKEEKSKLAPQKPRKRKAIYTQSEQESTKLKTKQKNPKKQKQ